MAYIDIRKFAEIAAQVVGELHVVPAARPYPWFCKDIFFPKDLQWAGYGGEFSVHKQALVFGINLEFTEAWKRVFPKIKGNLPLFSELISQHKDLEWHWMGRLGQRATNPEMRRFEWTWAYQVDYDKWLNELEDILNHTKMWKPSVPIRPQIQVMRLMGLPDDLSNTELITQNIQQTVLDLQPIVDFIGR